MIYVVAVGHDYEGLSTPAYAGTSETKARETVKRLFAPTVYDDYEIASSADYVEFITYNEEGERISVETLYNE